MIKIFKSLQPKNYHFLFLILFLVLPIIITSCVKEDFPQSPLVLKNNLLYEKGSNVPFTGREKDTLNNKIIEYDVKDGYKHGDFRIYSEDGTIEVKGQIDSNRNVGKWQYFYPNGEIESEGFFVLDKADGKWIWSYPDGRIKEEGFFKHGERIGMWYQYDHDGDTLYKHNYGLEDSTIDSR